VAAGTGSRARHRPDEQPGEHSDELRRARVNCDPSRTFLYRANRRRGFHADERRERRSGGERRILTLLPHLSDGRVRRLQPAPDRLAGSRAAQRGKVMIDGEAAGESGPPARYLGSLESI
jgi:hypothetical protein